MIVRSPQLRATPSFLLPFTQSTTPLATQTRKLYVDTRKPKAWEPAVSLPVKSRPIPRPTPFVPDTQTFLKLIGRNLGQYAEKISSWKDLFMLDSKELQELGITSARSRRYLQQWRERYRSGRHGIGGDLQYIQDGVAELRIVEVPISNTTASTATLSPGMRKIVVNVPVGGSAEDIPAEHLKPVKGVKIQNGNTITGQHVLQMRGKRAKIEVKEGLWEIHQGRKLDGGERRQAEVRAKRRGEERRAATGSAR